MRRESAPGPLGPLMCDLAGTALLESESRWLADPAVGGIILFARNLESPGQMRALCDAIRAVRPALLIAIDQEGGRVQRLRQGVTELPPMAALGAHYRRSPDQGLTLARDTGWLLAMEMAACGVDFSFAPVLDLDDARCPAIGDRAFSNRPEEVVALGGAFIEGLVEAGMAAVGKHFPGHGGVTLDSHLTLPEDARSLATLEARDLIPFRRLLPVLAGVMPAHVRFTRVDEQPAGFSRRWLSLLREVYGFQGAIVSDDLSMQGAAVAGGPAERVLAALEAGCDLTLVCNDAEAACQARRALDDRSLSILQQQRLSGLRFRGVRHDMMALTDLERWQSTRRRLAALAP